MDLDDSRVSTSSTGSDNPGSVKLSRTCRSLYKLSGLTEYQCSYCGNADVMLCLCGNCRTVAYCSKECQRLDWPKHKKPCKLKNPTHFQPEYRQKVTERFQGVPSEQLTGYLVDAFHLRCVDERQIHGQLPKHDEIPSKFLRFLHAAKGVKLLPDHFKKLDFMAIRNEAIYQYKITDIADEKDLDLQKYDDAKGAIEDLRSLHTVICGPVLIGDQQPNLI